MTCPSRFLHGQVSLDHFCAHLQTGRKYNGDLSCEACFCSPRFSEAFGEIQLQGALTVPFLPFFSSLTCCFSEGLPASPEGRRTRVRHLSVPAEPVLPALCLYCQSPSANQHGQPLSRGGGSNLGPVPGSQRFI